MNSTVLNRSTRNAAQPWIDWTNLILGIFFVVSPWLALGGSAAVAANAVICGAVIATAAGFALAKPSLGAERTNFYFALWLLIAPWALGFANHQGAMWTSVLIGLGVACLSGFQISIAKRAARG